ncbi:MAG TPA: chromosome segregation protein SMC [Polyangia bacterium]|nr:chromosome segregation protein SMC [Polyangia bacterium]
MRIKRLEVIGFKSFCDRSVVTFNEPITAVVGPNGCGKSNIVDAIRWCMGEQSAKHLRGGAMQDVIFAGSDSRGPLGMCEVTLVFENDGRVPIEYLAYSEIAVTRKLYRDGTSEYFLNKTPCRLRDVVDFFLGTGIGAKAYSIIEQGRVGMIVSSKPEDRRFLIEEAAGITKYKVKKKAAEKKMEATRQNLLRVSDVVAEIEKQLGSLRRQAQKAERYRQYKTELKDLELWSASQRWLGYLCEERVIGESHAEVTQSREDAQGKLAAREAEIEAARLEAAREEHALSELQQALYELDNRIKLGEAEADHEQREAGQLDERAVEARGEIEVLERQSAEDSTALDGARAELAALDEATAGQGDQVRSREDVLRGLKEELAGVQRKVDETRGEVGGCKADIARGESAERSAARRRDDLQIRVARVAEEDARLQSRGEELRVETARLGEKLDGLRQLKLDLTEERDRAEARVVELKQLLAKDGADLDTLTSELHRRRSRRASLEELHAKYEGFARGTRTIMQQKATRWGIRGLVADVVDAPAELEPAVEAVLAERLGAVVVESQEVGVDAIDYLKSKNEGRASFVPLNRFAGGEAAGDEAPTSEGVRGRLLDRVHVDEEYRGLAQYLFGGVIVVDDLLTALDLWRAGDHRTFVTLEGEVVDGSGVVTGGSREAAAAGVLAQKREIRELDGILAELETRHAELTARVTQQRGELSSLTKSLETLRNDAHQGEMQILTHDKDLHRLRDELERMTQRLNVLATEHAELEHQAREAAREAEEAQLGLRAARDRLVGLEDELSALARESVRLLELVEQAQEALTTLKVEVAQANEKRASLGAAIARLESARDDRALRREKLEGQIRDGSARAEELRQTAAGRRQELLGLAEGRARRSEELQLGRTAHDERRATLNQSEAELKALRSELNALHEEATRLELRRHDLASARQHLEESMDERYRVRLSEHVHDHHLRPLAGENEDRRAKELRDLIDRMGEINLNAIEEYNALEVRFTFLSGQKGDLEKALAQLEEAIDRINKTSRKRFREVFDLVNVKFQEIFPRCFRGGQARLVLTDEENLLESGIEIIAQPPGKKNATVEMLSGGEKAMTAVALIFAIFLIKPSPFCLLDEVDAPLDEANVGRFNDLIRELTDRTQFIVITHNKRTMQIADTLYGVTMEEPGISKLVSVNLGAVGKNAPDEKRNIKAA